MQFLMLIQIANDPAYESGAPPPAELQAAMGELMGKWSESGSMVAAAGLRPTSRGARIRSASGQVRVFDGPFTEAKEVIGGYFILDAADKVAAVAMVREFVEVHRRVLGDDFHLECELREVEA